MIRWLVPWKSEGLDLAIETMAVKSAPRELLGVSVVYLGGLNYFFPVHALVPVVSAVGATVGELDVHITPHIESSVRPQPARGSSVSLAAFRSLASCVAASKDQTLKTQAPTFEPYAVVDSDREEQQVYEFMDRPLLYVVELRHLLGIRTRRHSHVVARYSFFREPPTQTLVIPISDVGSTDASAGGPSDSTPLSKSAALATEFRHVVDVSDAFTKYITSGSLTVEVRSTASRGLLDPESKALTVFRHMLKVFGLNTPST